MRSSGLRLVAVATAAVATVVVATFLVALVLDLDPLHAATPESSGIGAALLAFTALVLDAVLPVPASIVMLGVGAVFPLAAALALVAGGRMAMSVLCLGIGRGGAALATRVSSADALRAARALVDRHGALAILLSRPVPVLAESVLVVAGMTRMRSGRALGAAGAASAAEAIVFVLAGRLVSGLPAAVVLWLVLLGVAALVTAWSARRLTIGRTVSHAERIPPIRGTPEPSSVRLPD